MRRIKTPFLLGCLLVVLVGCESRTDRTDSGGVILSVSDFDGIPISWSVNTFGSQVQLEEITVSNFAKDPFGAVSDLMNVEIRSYEVTFSRADNGTRVPPPYVSGLFGIAPVNGSFTVEGLPITGSTQFENPPLSDLFFANGGFDKETGNNEIILNVRIRFFGRTLSGDAVESDVATLPQLEFVP